MLNRRDLLIATAVLVSTVGAARAEDWKKQYPELTFAVVPAENASGVSDRYAGFADYLSKELGVPVKLRVANDYAAVIEGQRAGNIQIAYYGPASYSKAYLTAVKTEPFVTTRNNDGAIGYYSVIYVKADSPYRDIRDLRARPSASSIRTRPPATMPHGISSIRPGSMSTAFSATRSSPAAMKMRSSRWIKGRSTAPPIGGTPRMTRT
jgi:hypothetical protein